VSAEHPAAYTVGHTERVAAIRRERETRHWTIHQWKEAAADVHRQRST
jgi:hypothetical protein